MTTNELVKRLCKAVVFLKNCGMSEKDAKFKVKELINQAAEGRKSMTTKKGLFAHITVTATDGSEQTWSAKEFGAKRMSLIKFAIEIEKKGYPDILDENEYKVDLW